ncbi:hypothetical protein FHQ18_00505 [Deferribacter autotrophicus]|uniref:Tetratricopeptide repeat protein n=1 Tax=Deferribacter autotrophicus TaxID=500465 RepID=A0A5A8F926_9BACT|nr:hypothetical protein [Deferribacter autotrophicus]KAA0259392.1 hypothetical protein FHQ18_00505 [Deferribacter autotrophicus]
MKRLLFILLFFTTVSFAAVEVPNFSFVGKEVSSFDVKPSFTSIEINFSDVSQFNSYLQSAKIKIEEPEKKEFKAKEPGNIYSSKFGTALSAIFVGEKAYRNYLLKNFLKGDYINVIENYKKYYEKLKDEEIKDEVDFIYAVSLFKANFKSEAFEKLNKIIYSENIFRDSALDFYFDVLYGIDNKKLINIYQSIDYKTPYSTYVYLSILKQNKKYDEILKFISEKQLTYSFIKDFYVLSLYFKGDFEKIISIQDVSDVVLPFVVDAKISLNELSGIQDEINKIGDEYTKRYFFAKLKILDDVVDKKLFSNFKDIDKLSLMLFYISKWFPEINVEILKSLDFYDNKLNDYKNFYLGIYYLENREYEKTSYYLNKIIFNDKLYKEALFYRGIAEVYDSPEMAEKLLIDYINNSFDEAKVDVARFVVAQIRLLNDRVDDAFLIVADCSSNLCKRIKGEVFFKKGKFKEVLGITEGIKSDRVYFLRAAAYYNLKIYDEAYNELQKVSNVSKEVDYLKMLLSFKNDKIKNAINIMKKYKNDEKFIKEGVKYLFLAGDYNDTLYFINKSGLEDDYLTLIKAKALYSLKRYDEAEKHFQELLDKKKYLFDTIFGLISIKKEKNEKNFINNIFEITSKLSFKNKDFVILQLTKIAYENQDKESYMKLINYFFKNFPKSKYKKDAYILRGNFYKSNKMYQECIYDANAALAISKDYEALFLKAECTKNIDVKKAYPLFKELVQEKSGYEFLSKKELIFISDNSSEVLNYALYFKDKNMEIYLAGIERYLNFQSNFSDEVYQYVEELLNSGDEKFIPAGLYFKGKYLFEKKEYMYALKHFLKVYYLFKDSDYVKRSLVEAKKCYELLNKKNEAEKIEKILKKLEG